DATEILMWPLGGLASCDVPHTPRAHFITTACGPLVNLVIFLVCGALLAVLHDPALRPWLHPLYGPFRYKPEGTIELLAWSGGTPVDVDNPLLIFLARLFWVNWVLFLINIVIVGFPLDGGRLVQSIVWRFSDYHKGTIVAVVAGFIAAII